MRPGAEHRAQATSFRDWFIRNRPVDEYGVENDAHIAHQVEESHIVFFADRPRFRGQVRRDKYGNRTRTHAGSPFSQD